MTERRWLPVVALLWLAAVTATASAYDFGDFTNNLVHPQSSGRSEGISLDEAVARARREAGGKVISAETVRQGNRSVHRIKILTDDGRVKRLQYDAASGRPSKRWR
ncbi:MAG: hypothetical protein P8106_11185 [Gammaproteobacteria bacterium]|jgi:uncharacterized membrane protein YkoI